MAFRSQLLFAGLMLRKSITFFCFASNLINFVWKQAPGSPTVCLPAAFSEMEQYFKVSPAQPFTSQNTYLSLKHQLIFPYPHNIPIQHSVSWKSPIQCSPTCIQTPVIVLVLLLFSFQFRDYISQLTSIYLLPPRDTSPLSA